RSAKSSFRHRAAIPLSQRRRTLHSPWRHRIASMTGSARANIHVRSAFISDIHLGSRECRSDLILDFLRTVHMDQLFLIGDIVDVWSLKRSFYWPQSHNDVLRT